MGACACRGGAAGCFETFLATRARPSRSSEHIVKEHRNRLREAVTSEWQQDQSQPPPQRHQGTVVQQEFVQQQHTHQSKPAMSRVSHHQLQCVQEQRQVEEQFQQQQLQIELDVKLKSEQVLVQELLLQLQLQQQERQKHEHLLQQQQLSMQMMRPRKPEMHLAAMQSADTSPSSGTPRFARREAEASDSMTEDAQSDDLPSEPYPTACFRDEEHAAAAKQIAAVNEGANLAKRVCRVSSQKRDVWKVIIRLIFRALFRPPPGSPMPVYE